MAPFGAGLGISAPLRLRLRYAPIPTIPRTPLAGALTPLRWSRAGPVLARGGARAVRWPGAGPVCDVGRDV